ncbi:MAG TPA: transglycosylase SLT domain-containing protein [Rhodanobacteraceae bacterium]|nr:transglycosylase SLT domain-containing protein [Rhodanobacteraceae bacterium]
MLLCLLRPRSWSRRAAVALAIVALALPVLPARAEPPDLNAQRTQFLAAWAAAKLGGSQWHALAKGLEDYPLYPYIEAAALEHDIRSLKTPEVKAWLALYPDTIPAERLRRAYLNELVRRGDWDGFKALYRPGLGDALACDALRGRLATGGKLDFNRDLASLWQQTSLPPECTPVLDHAHAKGLLTRTRIWQRIEHVAEHGPARTIDRLARWLPKSQAAEARRLALARRSPSRALREARHWRDTPRARAAAALALRREARRDSKRADGEWQRLRKHFNFSASQRHAIEADIALYRSTNFTDHALERLTQLPAAAQNGATREWRVRVALAEGDWHQVKAALDAMPKEQQQDETWRYWRARTLQQLGHKQQAHALFAALADEADYYGFLAADWIDAPYTLCPSTIDGDAGAEQALLARPGLQRAFEFYALHLLTPARREWNRAEANLDDAQRTLAANLAYQRGWWDRAILEFASGSGKHLYQWRFPLARKSQVLKASKAAGIDPAWAYAIIRAESAWMPDAHSGADARGLMQLLPSTARHVARRNHLPYSGGADLYDPDVNIPLGTRYLGAMASRYDGAPWLASAAYNAGPNPVADWLEARGALAPDVFVATIPYKETREYVRRVMAFSVVYDWRLHGRALPLGARMPPVGQPYVAPDADSPRKPVRCPAPPKAPADGAVIVPVPATVAAPAAARSSAVPAPAGSH